MNNVIQNVPRHVAVIMDGNGRWAAARSLPRVMGHRAGVERLRSLIERSDALKIEVLTVYAFSTENWSRPKAEIEALMGLLVEYMKTQIGELVAKNVRITFIGDTGSMGKRVREALDYAQEQTKDNTGLIFNVALNYGGRAELAAAARKLAAKVQSKELQAQDITEETLADALYTRALPDPDVIIRTGGEHRLSNFLLYQGAYAELVFTPVFFPDFDDAQYMLCLEEYSSRQRRYGGL